MARPKKPPASKPSQAYIISFGDTMTTLLAFFIVLVSLAEDQTGANLHTGTGSFSRALDSMGMPGQFAEGTSEDAIQRSESSALYVAESDDADPPSDDPRGPDAEDNGLRIVDREAEQFQRFLNEMERHANRTRLPKTQGQVSFDFFNRLNNEPPYLNDDYINIRNQFHTLLQRAGYELDLVVWATTPSTTAWTRATLQAEAIQRELTRETEADPTRLRSYGRPWLYSDVKRPVLSLIVRKIETQ